MDENLLRSTRHAIHAARSEVRLKNATCDPIGSKHSLGNRRFLGVRKHSRHDHLRGVQRRLIYLLRPRAASAGHQTQSAKGETDEENDPHLAGEHTPAQKPCDDGRAE